MMIRGTMLTCIVLLLIPDQAIAADGKKVTEKYTVKYTTKIITQIYTNPPSRCPAGFSRLGNTCRQCVSNTFSDVQDAASCTRCPDGKVSPPRSTSISNCTYLEECPAGKVRCLDGLQCIDRWKRCDGNADCDDASDELSELCQGGASCPEGTITCADNVTCVSVRGMCDGRRYCPDGSDESAEFCRGYNCPRGQEKCGDAEKCVNVWKLCDGKVDCTDGSDENPAFCQGYTCPEKKFKCANGLQCINENKVCDGNTNCADGSDELPDSCPGYNLTLTGGGVNKQVVGGGGTGVTTTTIVDPCSAGDYMTDSGCEQCGENTFSHDEASSCTSCPDGKLSAAGSTSEDDCEFAPCSAGDYMTDSGCQQCGENTFSHDGASSCTSCPDGKLSAAGSTSDDDCEHEKRPTCDCMTPECDYCSNMDCTVRQDLLNSNQGIEVRSHVKWSTFNTIVLYDKDGNIISKLKWSIRTIVLTGCTVCKTPPALREASISGYSTWAFSLKDGLLTIKVGGKVLYERQLPSECAVIYAEATSFTFTGMTCENTFSFVPSEMEAGKRMTVNCGGSCPQEQ